jgi:predicted ATPase
LEGTSYLSRLENAQYEKIVFHLEPLPEHLYKNDTQRKETFDQAQQISQALKKAYEKRGFYVINIPFSTPKERADQIVSIASKYFAQIQKAA